MLFKRMHRLAGGTLRQTNSVRRLGKTSMVRHGTKNLQSSKVQLH